MRFFAGYGSPDRVGARLVVSRRDGVLMLTLSFDPDGTLFVISTGEQGMPAKDPRSPDHLRLKVFFIEASAIGRFPVPCVFVLAVLAMVGRAFCCSDRSFLADFLPGNLLPVTFSGDRAE